MWITNRKYWDHHEKMIHPAQHDATNRQTATPEISKGKENRWKSLTINEDWNPMENDAQTIEYEWTSVNT